MFLQCHSSLDCFQKWFDWIQWAWDVNTCILHGTKCVADKVCCHWVSHGHFCPTPPLEWQLCRLSEQDLINDDGKGNVTCSWKELTNEIAARVNGLYCGNIMTSKFFNTDPLSFLRWQLSLSQQHWCTFCRLTRFLEVPSTPVAEVIIVEEMQALVNFATQSVVKYF